ncbi:MAG: hypothetical protein KDA20_02450 [Phycisphaerales bacterium]|nr:hypothetical protein [Phycisphaerales bacterium]
MNGKRIKQVRGSRKRRPRSQKGVVGILAMMFLVMFASLATTLAIVTQGNLRSAVAHQRVVKSISAVDTGLEIAQARLAEAASRFIVAKGDITPLYASQLWDGSYLSDPPVTVIAPLYMRDEPALPTSIAQALAYHHASDDEDNIVAEDGSNAPAGIVLPDESPVDWVVTAPIGLERDQTGNIVTAAQITYLPPDEYGAVRVVVTGYTWDFARQRWVTRTAQQSFDMTKNLEQAVLAPSRLMIGRNVQINGPLGIRYNSQSLDTIDGAPLTMKSDFYGLSAELDAKLDDFYEMVVAYDVDGDNRLRELHSLENFPLTSLNANDYDGNGTSDQAFQDVTRDGVVDDFDIFVKHFDTNGDNKLVLSSDLIDGTPAEALTPEFTLDDALGMLIDSGKRDRNGNGQWNGQFESGSWDYSTFKDNNGDGFTDNSDVDADDVVLGYRDGVLDYRDRYAKVRGPITFIANRDDWETMDNGWGNPVGDYQQYVQGGIVPGRGEQPISFDASDSELPPIDADSFADATQTLIDVAESESLSFEQQVAAAMGGGYTPPTIIEGTPYGAPSAADLYERPVYSDITFKNVKIPMGTNALFQNCTFIGVTFVESYADNTHPSWPFYGQQNRDPDTGALEWTYPQSEDSEIALDKSWAEPDWEGYDSLPDPLMVNIDLDGDGTTPDQCINTKLLSNNLRFNDCLIVGSIVSTRTTVFHNKRNKIQFTGSTRFAEQHPDYPDDPDYNPDSEDMDAISRSSLMLPNYSVDIGTNNSDPDQDVHLHGAIVSGIIDIRGNAIIDGVLLSDFTPTYGVAPLNLYDQAVGNPADFNITLGYFGPEDGDEEGIDLSGLEMVDGQYVLGVDTARDPDTGAMITVAQASALGYDSPDEYPDAWFDGIADTDAEFFDGDWAVRNVTFNGFGRIVLNFDPSMPLPDGLATPIRIAPRSWGYVEGRLSYDE